MSTWMQVVNNMVGSISITPPAGEVWTLNSWSGFNTSSYTSFGTSSVYPLGVTGYMQSGINSFGSRTTMPIAFTNTLPLVVRSGGTSNGIISGYKYTTANAPYVPITLSATYNVGDRMILRPPEGKVWRIIGAMANSPNLGSNYWAIDFLNQDGNVWISAQNSPMLLAGGKADLWSWRDRRISIRSKGASQTIWVYILEFDEGDLISSRAYGYQSIPISGTYDIRPPAGEIWIIDGVYFDQFCFLVHMQNGVAISGDIPWNNASYSPGPFRIDNNTYLRVKNNNTAIANMTYMGRKIN